MPVLTYSPIKVEPEPPKGEYRNSKEISKDLDFSFISPKKCHNRYGQTLTCLP